MDTNSERLNTPTIVKVCGTPVGISRHDQLGQNLCRGCHLAMVNGQQVAYLSRLRLEAKSPPPRAHPDKGGWQESLDELIAVLANAMQEADGNIKRRSTI